MATLVLVDIENILGRAIPTIREIKVMKIFIDRLAGIKPDQDFYVIGCHDGLRKTVSRAWPFRDKNGRLNMQGFSLSGKDGGDKSILHWWELHREDLTKWNRIVLVSGDHYYLEPILLKNTRGKPVVQIARNRDSWNKKYKQLKNVTTILLTDVTSKSISDLGEAEARKLIDAWYEAGRPMSEAKKKQKKIKVATRAQVTTPSRGKKQNSVEFDFRIRILGVEYAPKFTSGHFDYSGSGKELFLSRNTLDRFISEPFGHIITIQLKDGQTFLAAKVRETNAKTETET